MSQKKVCTFNKPLIWLGSCNRNPRLDHDMKNDHFGFLSIRLLMLKPVAYGILWLSQQPRGFLSHTPENNVKIIWNWVHIINGIRLLIKSVQRQYYLLSCRFLLFTGRNGRWKEKYFLIPILRRPPQQSLSIKALLGMLARLPWGRRDMLGSMNGKYEGLSVKYASLIVSCYWIKVFIIAWQ